MTLEEQFHQDMVAGDELLRREHGYNASYYRQMLGEFGGIQTARRLLASETAQVGLHTLCEMGLLEHSMEQLVLRFKYRSLFTEEERAKARKRLRDLKYEPRMD